MLYHTWPTIIGGGGMVGVVIFFALSGYLITGVLLGDLERHGRVRYGRFYRNRALRLLPSLVLMLAVFAPVEGVLGSAAERGTVQDSILAGLSYTANLPGLWNMRDSATHLWTLSTEEQFYLVWPLVVSILAARSQVRQAVVVVLALIAVLGAVAATISITEPAVYRIYRLPTSWASTLVIGSAARIWVSPLSRLLNGGRRRIMAVGSVIVLMCVAGAPEMKGSPLTYVLLAPLVAMCSVVLIFHVRPWTSIPHSGLRPLLALGIVSYDAYLWNYPIVRWMDDADLGAMGSVISLMATCLAAWISWVTVDRMARGLRTRLDRKDTAQNDATETSRQV